MDADDQEAIETHLFWIDDTDCVMHQTNDFPPHRACACDVVLYDGTLDMFVKLYKSKDHLELCPMGNISLPACACAHGRLDVFQYMMTIDYAGPPLCLGCMLRIAAHGDHYELVCYLLDKGADVNEHHDVAEDLIDDDMTPMHLAASNGNVEMMEILRTRGAVLHSKYEGDITPLDCAVMESGNLAAVQYLVKHTSQKNIHNTLHKLFHGLFAFFGDEGEVWGDIAVSDKNIWCLVDHVLDVNWTDPENRDEIMYTDVNLLFSACRASHFRFVRDCLIPRGVDLLFSTKRGRNLTVLHMACQMYPPSVPLLELLLSNGLSVNARDGLDLTPLDHIMIKFLYWKGSHYGATAIQYLLFHGAQCNNMKFLEIRDNIVDVAGTVTSMLVPSSCAKCLDHWTVGNIASYVFGFPVTRKDVYGIYKQMS